MKTRAKPILLGLSLAILLCLAGYLLARCVFLAPCCYTDSTILGKQENAQIKKLLLEAVADRCSIFDNTVAPALYDTTRSDEILQLDGEPAAKWVLVRINHNFMNSLVRDGENGYSGFIKPYFMEQDTEDGSYAFTIEQIDGNYKITSWGIDP